MDVVERHNEILNEKVTDILIPSYTFYEAIVENNNLTFAEWVDREAIIAKNTMPKKDLYSWADSENGKEAVNDYFCEMSCIKPVYFDLTNFLRDALQYAVRENLHEFNSTIIEHTLIYVLHDKGFYKIDDNDFEEMRLAVLQDRSAVTYDDFVQVIKEHIGETGE